VDISGALETAQVEAVAASDSDGPYGELMANYAQWGALLEEWNSGRSVLTAVEFEAMCRDHLERSVVLGEAHEQYWEQRWATRFARFNRGAAG
jgi:hypothetical protein